MIPANKRTIPFLVLFLLLLSLLLYHSTICLLPSFVHAWTQSERYAIALRFLDNGFDFFHPATFNLQTIDGVTRMDLPLNEFVVAVIMKILGTTAPIVFRLYTLCVSITGLVFLYLLTKKITGSELKAWLMAVFVFLSPLYTYYQAGFIPCVPAISFVIIAYYFFYDYKLQGNKKQFYLSILFFFLAAMIRLPFLIFPFAFFLQQCFLLIKTKKFIRHEFIGFSIAFGVFAAYYRYNVHLGIVYGNMFLDTFLPAKNMGELIEILGKMFDYWLLQYFTIWHYILFIIAFIYALVSILKNKKLKNKAVSFNLLILWVGTTLYFLLMARQYYDHDYYFLDSFFVPFVFLFMLFLNHIPLASGKRLIVIIFLAVIFVVFMFVGSSKNQSERYQFEPWDRVEISRLNFMNSDKYLDSIGISKDAKMLVIESYSTNIPLYLMKRKGYTVYQTNRDNAALALFRFNWDYVVIQDQFLLSDVLKYYPVVSSVIEPIAGNGKITVYKRSKRIQPKSLKEFLGITPERIVFKFTSDSMSSSDHKILQLDSLTEYGITAVTSAKELKYSSGLKILVSSDLFFKEPFKDIQLVTSITSNGKSLYYQSFALSEYFKVSPLKQKMEFQFVLPALETPEDELKVYLWNPGKANLTYENWEVVIYK
jgi:hypothetical protein